MYETATGSTAPPSLFRSQDTVDTLGSMNHEFVQLMQPASRENSTSLGWMKESTTEDLLHLDDLDLRLSSRTLASLDLADMADEVLDEDDWMSDDSSLLSGAAESLSPAPTSRAVAAAKARVAKKVHKAKASTTGTKKKRRVRKNYENLSKGHRVYVQYTDSDVLCQRGGLANRHPGNHRYLQAKEALQPTYFATPQKGTGRTQVAQSLVDQVHAWGGRFLRLEKGAGWYEVHNHTARDKASQALREVYTPEARKEKRDRHKAASSNNNNRVAI